MWKQIDRVAGISRLHVIYVREPDVVELRTRKVLSTYHDVGNFVLFVPCDYKYEVEVV